MGMIKCSKHGLQHIILCSQSIAEAVDEGRYHHANVMIDKWGQPGVVGDRDLDGLLCSALPWGWPDLELDPPIAARCELDVDEWLAETGQGMLADLIARARPA